MTDTLTRFYQDTVANGAGTTAFTVPADTTYTVRNIVLCNNSSTGGSINASAYVNSVSNANTIIPSGSTIVANGFLQTTDFYVFGPGDSLKLVLASGTAGSLTASVHGIVTTVTL